MSNHWRKVVTCNCPECQEQEVAYWNRQKKIWGTISFVFVVFMFWLISDMNAACIDAGYFPDVCGF